jgi:hypothetical protein
MKPPRELDGAEVMLWAWSEPAPFFGMPCSDGSPTIPIHGLAVCRHAQTGSIYRFSCKATWEVENDSTWPSIEAAVHGASGQYDIEAVSWQPR